MTVFQLPSRQLDCKATCNIHDGQKATCNIQCNSGWVTMMTVTSKISFRLAIPCFQLVKYYRTITLEIYSYLWQNDLARCPLFSALRVLSCSDNGGGRISIFKAYMKYHFINNVCAGKVGEVGSGLLTQTIFCPRTPPLLRIKPGRLQGRLLTSETRSLKGALNISSGNSLVGPISQQQQQWP